jgi:nucleotide-binding universal stress UspA family protein
VFEQVIVGWDGAPTSSAALEWLLAMDTGIQKVRLVRVFERSLDAHRRSDEGDDPARSVARVVAAEVDDLQLKHPGLTVDSEFVFGDREAELQRRAGGGALLVLGSTARQGHRARFHWSLGVRLAARVPGAVLVVPEGAAPAVGPIVVGVDGTAASAVAGRIGASLASTEHRPLLLVHAWQEVGDPDVPAQAIGAENRSGSVDAISPLGPDLLQQRHAQVLEQAAERLRDEFPGVPIDTSLVREAPADALVAASEGAALVVLGKHGRFDVSTWLLGSVAHEMLLRLPVPTLVVGTADLPAGLDRVAVVHKAAPAGV